MTTKDLLDRLPKCKTSKDAISLVQDAKMSFGDNAYGNIRYCIGYFDGETRTRLYSIFNFL